MTRKTSTTRHPKPTIIDQRQQQIDPAGENRKDRNWRPNTNTKQPSNLPESKSATPFKARDKGNG